MDAVPRLVDGLVDPAKALDALHEALTLELKTDRKKREKADQALSDKESPSGLSLVFDAEAHHASATPTSPAEAEDATSPFSDIDAPQQAPLSRHAPANSPLSETSSLGTPEVAGNLFGGTETKYVTTHFDGTHFVAEPGIFHSDEYSNRLSAMIDHVIDTEGPIHQDVLIRRIARHHGFRRAGRQIHDRVIRIAKRRRGKSKENVGLFFWRKGTVKNRLVPTRYKGRDDEMRKIEYICREELRAIRESLSLNDDPIELARRIGIARLSQRARQRIMDTLAWPHNPNI